MNRTTLGPGYQGTLYARDAERGGTYEAWPCWVRSVEVTEDAPWDAASREARAVVSIGPLLAGGAPIDASTLRAFIDRCSHLVVRSGADLWTLRPWLEGQTLAVTRADATFGPGGPSFVLEIRAAVGAGLHDPDWPGDAKVAGWWLWGQCCWIGSGWCEWDGGKVPHASSAGMGVQAIGKVPQYNESGRGILAIGKATEADDSALLTSAGRTAWRWLHELANRLERGNKTPVADEVAAWALENQHLRVALCGHVGDYDLPG